MQTYPTSYTESHRMAEKIFREILPRHSMAVREEQIALCHEVLDTLYNKEISLCEAGVGTGKTLAYLVGCILWQMHRPERMKLPIVISTSSVALQDAILTEYLPDLSAILQDEGIITAPITAVVRKGKERFVCDARLAERASLVQPSRERQTNSLNIAAHILDMDHIPELSRYDRYRISVPRSCPRDCFMRLDCRYQQYLRDSMKPDIQICNHNYLLADAAHRMENQPLLLRSYQALVVDEAHYVKNPEAQRTKNVTNLSDHTERLLFMTGTALENKVDEMISLIKILQPTVASSVRGMEFLSSAPEFRSKVAPVYYRRKREDVLKELPDLIENMEWCTMTSVEEAVYEDAVLNKGFAAARRVSWNVDDLKDSSKAMRMKEIIEEAEDDGRKVIVFSFFLDTIKKITEMLGKRCYGPINGSVTPQRRQDIIDDFDKAPAGSVLAAQIQAGGTGLNIQSASVVILCEPQFKPSTENQAISRAYRMGQTRNVIVYRLLCEDTVDERITALLESKQEIFDAFADKSEAANESRELDEKDFGNIIKEEIDRINAKRGNPNGKKAE